MTLLHLLANIRQRLPLSLVAVWVDHGLRPAETPAEEKMVRCLAQELDIPFFARCVDTAGLASAEHLSLEHAARNLRYRELRKVSDISGADYIAVGHTSDDQVEEVLLRLLRGSGRKGLSGMSVKNGDIIRPLLTTGKDELVSWLKVHSVTYCHDSSNDDLQFLRNRIRHTLLPFLENTFDTNIRKSLQKTAETLAIDEALLEELTIAAFYSVVTENEKERGEMIPRRILRKPFGQLHAALQRRVVERLLWRLGAKAGFDHIKIVIEAALHGRTNSELHLAKGLRVGIFSDYLEFSYPQGCTAWRGRLFK